MAVYLKYHRDILIDIQNDSIQVFSTQSNDLLNLNEQAKVLAREKVHTSHLVSLIDIQAKTLVPNGKRYKEIAVENFEETDDRARGVFYDDSKSVIFVFPGVQPGSRSILDYTTRINDPRFLTSFYFGSFIPVEESKLTIKVNKKISLNFKVFNQDQHEIEFTTEEKGDFLIYQWKARELPSISLERDAPKISYFSPHVIYYIKEAQINGQAQVVLRDVNDLYRMYYGFLENVNKEDDQTLKSIVDSLTTDLSTDEEKVKEIFYWVQDHIKYIAFEDGMRGFIPHSAGLVCDKRYGDCKDMASITQNMLQLANIKSHFAWVGSRDLPYKYSEIPTPVVDNHMISVYDQDGEYVFLDATSKYTPFGFPSSMIQGKEVLIAIDEGRFQIRQVPVVDRQKNVKADSSYFSISGNTISGSGELKLRGYPKVYNAYKLIGLDDTRERRFVTDFLKKGNNKFFVEDYSIQNLEEREHNLIVDYQYKVEDYVKQVGDEIFLNLNLNKVFFNEFIDLDKRTLPKENDYFFTHKYTFVFEIPENYKIEYLPTNQAHDHKFFGFDISYEIEGNKIIQKKEVYLNYLILEPENFEDWNNLVQQLNEAYREVLILKKKKA